MSPASPAALSPRWALLALPVVCLAAGWFVAQLPTPAPREPQAEVREEATTVSATVERPSPATESRPTDVAPPRHEDVEVRSRPVPAVAARPQEAPRAERSRWTTLEDAMAQSQRTGKPVLIDFNADWCGPCQAMKRQVFEDGALGEAVELAVIPVSIVDRKREQGSNPPDIDDLQQRFAVTAFPTLVVLSAQTGRAMRSQGFGGAERTLLWITEAAKAVR